jgi:hypothetical protein
MYMPRPGVVALTLIALSWALAGSAGAVTIYNVQLDNDLFGNLDQDDVASCKDQNNVSFSCGAVAATNSFAFLQRQYPGVYGESLIPDVNDNDVIDYDELVSTAETVA